MRSLLIIFLVAAMPAAAADSAIERSASRVGKALDRAGRAVERGGDRTAKAVQRPVRATQRGLERTGKKIDDATGAR